MSPWGLTSTQFQPIFINFQTLSKNMESFWHAFGPWNLSGPHFGGFGITFESFGVTFGALGESLGPSWGTLGPRPLKSIEKTLFWTSFWDRVLNMFALFQCMFFNCNLEALRITFFIDFWSFFGALWNPKLMKRWCRQPSRKIPTILTTHLWCCCFLWKGRRTANTIKNNAKRLFLHRQAAHHV